MGSPFSSCSGNHQDTGNTGASLNLMEAFLLPKVGLDRGLEGNWTATKATLSQQVSRSVCLFVFRLCSPSWPGIL